ncbi:hypothetical protein [Sporosarcina limicola]|uniref:Uncharacterized protein n=1 Tax=Sporosarcina limicola TaxID=34101 RepID=A0A927MH00_9BACL|nr:hypothetical protein [Sporosarcina limicola]MBE1554524.1 hypothetical protein [Sporosarcina limicola]
MDNLHQKTKELLLRVHAKHTATMGQIEKEKHSLENIRKVVVDRKEKCLKVCYEHEWYHYAPNGAWY